MEDIFIQKIHIGKVRHLENIDISIDDKERKHLILTGKNGSGKTSVLEGIRDFLKAVENGEFNNFSNLQKQVEKYQKNIDELNIKLKNIDKQSEDYGNTRFEISNEERNRDNFQNIIDKYTSMVTFEISDDTYLYYHYTHNNFIITFFPAQRIFKPVIPKNAEKINLPKVTQLSDRLNTVFIKYLVDLDYKSSRAYKDKDQKTIQEIENWFSTFSSFLKIIFGDDSLEIKFYESEQGYNFRIYTKDREPFDLTTLSDGYASILNLVTELILRMENKQVKNYDVQGIVLIDEIETHLHIDLQKKILPFLTTFFPKIQFIVTTHSPFVLSSISDAVIFDLEKKIRVEDLSAYAVDGIIEGYFESDKYSTEIKEKVVRYESLLALTNPNMSEKEEILSLRKLLKGVSPQLAPELAGKFLDLELSRVGK